jgi:hypothetical protein
MKMNVSRFGTGKVEDFTLIHREFGVFHIHWIVIISNETVKCKCLKFSFKQTLQFCYKFTEVSGSYPYCLQLKIMTQLYFKIMYLK